jgi:hypothetical protein
MADAMYIYIYIGIKKRFCGVLKNCNGSLQYKELIGQ